MSSDPFDILSEVTLTGDNTHHWTPDLRATLANQPNVITAVLELAEELGDPQGPESA